MKFGPVTKLGKRNKAKWKKSDDDVMLENCDVIVVFPIYGQFELDSRCIACKIYIFIKSNLLSYKNWKPN